MRITKGLFLSLFFILTTSAQADSRVLETMLSIGASVTANKKTPGQQIADASKISNAIYGVSGGPSDVHYSFVEKYLKKDRPDLPDMIVGIDFFFHDFGWGNTFTEVEQKRIDHYLQRFTDVSALVVIGNIPNVFNKKAPALASQYLKNAEKKFSNFLVIDLASIYKEIYSEKGFHYTIDGANFYVKAADIMIDKLHPTPYGCALIANLIVYEVHKKYPEKFPELKFIPVKAP